MKSQQIRDRATKQSYGRGEAYYQNGAIFDTVSRGNTLEGRCEGSSYAPYHVRATLDDDGNIEATSCTCDYAYDGDCKHIVALLLAYAHKPQMFEERAAVADTLAERNQEELIALIRQMVTRYPDLQALIDRPLPGRQQENKPVDTGPFRRELRQALNYANHWDDDGHWGDSSVEDTVQSIADAARAFADAGRWHDASAIYRAILEECLHKDQYPADDEGEFIWALNPVLDAVVECLQQDEIAADGGERIALLDHLLDAYIWDIDMGGQGLGDETFPDGLLQNVRPQDIPRMRVRVQEAQQRKGNSSYGRWGVEAYELFLIQLDALDNTDPEKTLERLREQGMFSLLFKKLLEMGRIDEAITVVSKHLTNPYERLLALPQLVAAGCNDEAIKLASETIRKEFDDRLAHWLAERYRASDDHNALFELWLQGMQENPNVGYYAALKQAAETVDKWAMVRPDILHRLEQKREYGVLTQIYLHEEEWDAAWETVEHSSEQPSQLGWAIREAHLRLEVAERSQYARPHKAIPIFVKQARQEIAHKDRGHYRQAAAYLLKVRDLYRQISDENSWRKLILSIRNEFSKLRALQDELNQAGL